MHIVLIEPRFPPNQKHFVRALAEVGVRITAIGEGSKGSLDDDLRRWLTHYEEVTNVTDEAQVLRAVRFIQQHAHVDRLEATVEAHILPAARVREAAGIPGTSVRTAFLCRDKPSMKEVLTRAGVPCAQSLGSGDPAEIRDFVRKIGTPVILKPRDGAGASGTVKVVLRLALPSGTEEGVVWEVREGHLGDVAEGREIPVRRASPSGYVAPAVPFAELSEMHTRLWVRGT